jgi:hypothetical protein
MNSLVERIDPFWLALVFAASMLVVSGIGWWRGGGGNPEPGEDPGIKFTDAALALLGLLLAFTFSTSPPCRSDLPG